MTAVFHQSGSWGDCWAEVCVGSVTARLFQETDGARERFSGLPLRTYDPTGREGGEMVREQIQNYVNLMTGLRRATKAKASEAAQGLLSATGLDDVATDAGERVSNLAEEILTASRANRELLVKMINTEIDKAA